MFLIQEVKVFTIPSHQGIKYSWYQGMNKGLHSKRLT